MGRWGKPSPRGEGPPTDWIGMPKEQKIRGSGEL